MHITLLPILLATEVENWLNQHFVETEENKERQPLQKLLKAFEIKPEKMEQEKKKQVDLTFLCTKTVIFLDRVILYFNLRQLRILSEFKFVDLLKIYD